MTGYLLVAYYLFYKRCRFKNKQSEMVALSDSIPQLSAFTSDTIPEKNYLDTILYEYDNSRILFPSGDSTVLYPFFRKLKDIKEEENPFRIMYFGDSQIEEDRITSTIRKRFQQKYGGAGIGFIAPDLLYNLTHSFTISRSDNWQIINYSDSVSRQKNHSLVFKEAMLPANHNGWFKIKQIGRRLPDYLQMKMLYQSKSNFNVILKQGGILIYEGVGQGGESVHALNFDFSSTPPSIELYLEASDSLLITGFSFEKGAGLQVDNIALRGFSYPPFLSSDEKSLKETVDLIAPALCILHFGVNVVPTSRKNYNYYCSMLVREIREMQKLMPDVPVLIVGVSDMATREEGKMVSCSNIHAIKKAQIEAARQCNCAFFDLEKFMGGVGAMVCWVNASPRLGQKDYIHFTRKGTEKIGNILSSLLLENYETYLEKESEE